MSFYKYCKDNNNNNNDNDYTDELFPRPSPPSPKLITDGVIDELCKYFKLNNLLNMIRIDENEKPKHDVTISNTIMDSIIDKKLGSITYHFNNTKSIKAYHTYDYPEIYYNKKLYNNATEWIKEEFKK
jgi:hypothetical protein